MAPDPGRRIRRGGQAPHHDRTYALSAGYYDAYYGQAQKVRTLIARDFASAFESVDVLVSPGHAHNGVQAGEKVDDPLAMYLFDLCTLPVNLAGVAAMSVPSGLSDDGCRRAADHGPGAGRRPALPGRCGVRIRTRPDCLIRRGAKPARDGWVERMARYGILTSGGDCPGLNAVIRGTVLPGHGGARPGVRRIPRRLPRPRARRHQAAHPLGGARHLQERRHHPADQPLRALRGGRWARRHQKVQKNSRSRA